MDSPQQPMARRELHIKMLSFSGLSIIMGLLALVAGLLILFGR